ncbi:PASTA domain-containing protein [Streptomyces sp. NPDC006393]|uniref:PASTA domain-containing protein n=1 Tax=Streptomyces sp. NPDC006393 TaxID=3156763 RepID=UPI0033D90157
MYDPNIPQQPTKTSRPWYRMKRTWLGGFAALVVIGAIAGGSGDSKDAKASTPAPVKTVTATPTPTPTSASASASADDTLKDPQDDNTKDHEDLQKQIDKASKSAEANNPDRDAGTVPDVVGMNHAEALHLLHLSGFMVNEEDASGDRWILDNSNWKVCRQEPGPGYHPTTLRVAIYSVKLDESC